MLSTLGVTCVSPEYKAEVDDILDNSVKIPKFNEKFGFAPHIV